jgi:hypothetical protein
VTGAEIRVPYAFDPDPDGSYTFHDRVMRQALDQTPWPNRIHELRIAGVAWVVTDELLSAPYREVRLLSPSHGVRLYALAEPAPRLRLATRIFTAPHFQATVAIHQRPEFDPSHDTVIPGGDFGVTETAEGGRIETHRVRSDELRVTVDSPAGGVLVWSTSFHPAWKAFIDGQPARIVPADGHLVGVALEAGSHEVRVVWDRTPLWIGLLLLLLGCLGITRLRRPRMQSFSIQNP